MKKEITFPFYAKVSLICVGLFAFLKMLSIAEQIIVPLLFALLIAILLNPLVNFLMRKGIKRALATIIVLVTVFGLLIFMAIVLSNQIWQFGQALPELMSNFDMLVNDTIAWFSSTFNVSIGDANLWMDTRITEITDGASSEVGQTLISTGTMLIFIILVPVYIFMLLVYKPLLMVFVHKLFSADNQNDVNDVILKTKRIIQGYLIGLMTEALIIAVLYSAALLILGIQYAFLLAIIGALINLIPYLGAIIAAALPMAVALATKSPIYALLVLASYIFIQIIDNNYIIPKVVASKVRINALISVIVVIAGGALWGIAGMFLSIPLTAIVKVIFDHVDGLKPLGYVFGNRGPDETTVSVSKK